MAAKSLVGSLPEVSALASGFWPAPRALRPHGLLQNVPDHAHHGALIIP